MAPNALHHLAPDLFVDRGPVRPFSIWPFRVGHNRTLNKRCINTMRDLSGKGLRLVGNQITGFIEQNPGHQPVQPAIA